MGILGKILIILNLFAAAGFAYLTLEIRKLNQAWTFSALEHEVALTGLPLDNAPPPADLDSESAAVSLEMNRGAIRIDRLPKALLQRMIPNGGQVFGTSEVVTSQDQEAKRLLAKLQELVKAAATPADARALLRTYLLNLAKSSPGRDAINAFLRDILNPVRAAQSRADLAYLGQTDSAVNVLTALHALAPLNNDAIFQEVATVAAVRGDLARFLTEEVSRTVPPTIQGEDRVTAINRLVNAAIDLGKLVRVEAPEAGRVEKAKQDLVAAGDSGAQETLTLLADIGGNLLANREALVKCREDLLKYAAGISRTPSEIKVYTGVAELYAQPALAGDGLTQKIQEIGDALLAHHFELATAPLATSKGDLAKEKREANEKRSLIAHLLYHIDANYVLDRPGLLLEKAWEERVEWHRRVRMVVGANLYLDVAQRQATELGNMVVRLEAAVTEEQGRFEPAFQTLVREAVFQARQLQARLRILNEKELQLTKQTEEVNARTAERDDMVKGLEERRVEVAAALVRLAEEQDRLFKVQQDVVRSQDSLLLLEMKIRELERKIVASRDGSAGN